MKSKQVLVLEYVFIVLLGVLMSLGYIFFVITNNFAPAGINGIAVMVQYKLNFSVGFMYYNISFLIARHVFCVIYRFFLGVKKL